jgi:methionyl aminopeptidase
VIAKHQKDIDGLRAAGRLLSEVLREVASMAGEGVSSALLNQHAEERIKAAGAVPSFLNYTPPTAPYPYPAALCVSINDEVVHGIPSEEKIFKKGDIVSLDLGLSLAGYFVDSALTVAIGGNDEKGEKLLACTREALAAAVAAASAGNHMGDIGAAVETVVKKYNLAVVKDLGGHAVGKSVHEKPFIANYGKPGHGEALVEGMVLALEPIVSEGKGAIDVAEDGWAYGTRDHSRTAHFEQTILIAKDGAEVFTPFL